MEQGRTERRILQDCQRLRMPVPDAIANAPELDFGNDFYFSAYLELSSCRTDGPIPWTAIADYCRAFDLCDDEVEDLMRVVRLVDSDILEYKAAKQEAARQQASRTRGRK